MSTSCTATKRTSNAYWLFIFFWNYAVVTSSSDTFPAERFLDRELSWLSFNQRVLELAEDENLPILERAKFLAIFASNLDEFFMVRVAGLKRRIATGIAVRSASGKNPKEVLESIWDRAHSLQREHA
jgi:polyphosphate kinase